MNKIFTATIVSAALASAGVSAQTLSVGSNPQGSLAYSTAAGIAKIVTEATNLKLRVVPQGGPVVVLPLVNKGELDFSIALSVPVGFGLGGKAMFKKAGKQEDLRVVASLFPLLVGLYVQKDSKIKKVEDVKGMRMGSKFTKQKIIAILSAANLSMVGLTPKDVKGVPVSNGVRQVQDFMAGKIDAVVWSITSGATAQAHAKVGIRMINLPNTPEAKKAMQKLAPGTVIQTIKPSKRFPFLTQPTNVIAGPFVLVSSTKIDAKKVYEVVKAIHANKKKLVTTHKAFNGMQPKRMHLDIGLPYHKGAEKFFKEAGL
jgi:TRAP transporter TAXI family solute receptor